MKTRLKLSCCFVLCMNTAAYADIVTDGTTGIHAAHILPPTLTGGKDFVIPQSLGTTVGGNLFHSFETFNINTGESATFTGNARLNNVISRVTGGSVSKIDGLLKSDIPHANFYFINPAGITFGANASVDVPAAFHVSTSGQLNFKEGNAFTLATPASQFNIAEPDDFGFLGAQAGDIKLQGNTLSFDNKKAVSLTSSRDVVFDDAELSNPSGKLAINAKGNVTLKNSSVNTNTSTADKSGDITVTARTLIAEKSWISSETLGAGNAGNIEVNASKILVDGQGDGAGIISNTYNDILPQAGHAGAIKMTGDSLTVLNGGVVSSSTRGAGNAGNMVVNIGKTLIDGQANNKIGTGISSTAYNAILPQAGHGGAIKITGDSLTVLNDGVVSSSTLGAGNAGNVEVNASKILIDGQGNETRIRTGISSSTYNDILPQAGHAGAIKITGDRLAVLNNGVVASVTRGAGNAGNIKVTVPTIVINNAKIYAIAAADSSGQTGNITINASKTLQLANHAEISITNHATIVNPTAIKAGLITISALDIELKNSKITAESTGNVDASNIKLNFSHWLSLDPSFISTTANTGNGGDITIKGGELISLENSGFLTSVSGENSNGGNINVNADLLTMQTGVIQANAVGGSGGDVNVNLKSLIASQNHLVLGGAVIHWQPYILGLNVIQAASERGVSGAVNLSSPQLDISGSINSLDASILAAPDVDRNGCDNVAVSASSLARASKGGIPLNEAQHSFIPPIATQAPTSSHLKNTITPSPNTLTGDALPCAHL